MKKTYGLLLLLFFGFALFGCEKPNNNNNNNDDDPDNEKLVELLDDPTFATGFNVLGISPVVDGRSIKMKIDYNGTAKPADREIWYMAQWWTPYNLTDSIYSYQNGIHIYQTESRTIAINPNDHGYLHFDLSSSKEYNGGTRKSGEPWTHALIEQNFSRSVKLSELEELKVHLELSVEKVENKNGKAYDPSMHAAQFLWYFTIRNVVPEESNPDEVGQNGDFLWFGVPIYDNRSPFIDQSAHIDTGAPGTTGKLIYSMSSRNYFEEPLQMGKTYTVDVDILPFLKEAFIYGVSNGVLVNCQYSNMEVGYMNFGWELPGAFDVSSTIRNMSAKAILK